jgi:aspartate kinase
LAAALGAERCEIYSDVDGVYSADPRVVPEAVHLPALDLASLQEMAEAGAKVVNAQAVEWARLAKITLHARRTTDSLDAHRNPARETIAREAQTSRVRAVVGMDRVVGVCVPAASFRVFVDCAAELHVPLLDVMAAEDACATIPMLNIPDWSARRAQLEALVPLASWVESRAMVSLVGDGLTGGDALPRFLDALGPVTEGAAPLRIVAGPLRLSALIPSSKLAESQRALHAAFVIPFESTR